MNNNIILDSKGEEICTKISQYKAIKCQERLKTKLIVMKYSAATETKMHYRKLTYTGNENATEWKRLNMMASEV